MRRIVFRPAAEADLHEIVAYIADRSPDSAERFGDAARATVEWLAANPGVGRRVDLGARRPDPRRQFAVRGFRAYPVFHRHTRRELIVVRVLHGARNFGPLLGPPPR